MITKSSKHMSKRLALALIAVFALFGAVILSNTTANAATTTVQVGVTLPGGTSTQRYNAPSVTVAQGDTVTWNLVAGAHDVTSAGAPAFASSASPMPASYSVTFNTAGTYYYYCSIHAGAADATAANVTATDSGGKMVGRVIVAAPVLDTAAPTVSAVTAPANTAGAGSITLTATVTDTVQAGSTDSPTVASAEWAKAAGGPWNAMAAVDGAFGGSPENVTGNVPITEAVGTVVTLFVRGTDQRGNISASGSTTTTVGAPPAGAVPATISVTAGGLTNTTALSIAFPGITLNGTDQTVAVASTGWNAKDARGTGAGWNVTLTSTPFTGAGTIAVANFKTQLLAANISPAGPLSQVLSFQPLSGAALKLLNATGAAGMGSFNYAPDFQLTVPASAIAGSYSANVTVSINSGP